MYDKELKELVMISQFAGKRIDYTQGGGGNTSVKLDSNLMAIKASGYKLSEITQKDAYVTVNYQKVKQYYDSVNLNEDKDFEAESLQAVKDATELLPEMKNLRPSVEVGFHALLNKYVIHIHSVYAAIIVCSQNGEELCSKMLKDKDYGFIFVPYINPGFSLSLEMAEKVKQYKEKYNKAPEVIFMKNHGLVVHSDDCKRAMDIVKDVNETIMNYFNISIEEFKEIKLETVGDSLISNTPVVKKYLKDNTLDKEFLDNNPLYPDQLVYLNNCLSLTPEKMRFADGNVIYSGVTLNEVLTLEETLSAFIFVILKIKENNLPLSLMGKKDVDFINNWESEKFRRSMVK